MTELPAPEVVGPWFVPFKLGRNNMMVHLTRTEDRAILVPDPWTIIFMHGGTQCRVRDFDTDHPFLQVKYPDGIYEFKFRLKNGH